MKGVMFMAKGRFGTAVQIIDTTWRRVLIDGWYMEYERAALISALELLLDEARASANREEVEQDG